MHQFIHLSVTTQTPQHLKSERQTITDKLEKKIKISAKKLETSQKEVEKELRGDFDLVRGEFLGHIGEQRETIETQISELDASATARHEAAQQKAKENSVHVNNSIQVPRDSFLSGLTMCCTIRH